MLDHRIERALEAGSASGGVEGRVNPEDALLSLDPREFSTRQQPMWKEVVRSGGFLP